MAHANKLGIAVAALIGLAIVVAVRRPALDSANAAPHPNPVQIAPASNAEEAVRVDQARHTNEPHRMTASTGAGELVTAPAEADLVRDGAMDSRRVGELVDGADFAAFVDQLARESVGMPEAQRNRQVLAANVRGLLADVDADAELRRIACGASVCALELSGNPATAEDYIAAILDGADAKNGPSLGATATAVIREAPDRASIRMLSTTAAGARTFLVPKE